MSAELFWQMNHATEQNGATGEKHAPTITIEGDMIPGEVVRVEVDVSAHPSKNEHFIQFIVLRGNGLYIARKELTAVICKAKATFELVVPASPIELTAISRCNVHGLWESSPVTLG